MSEEYKSLERSIVEVMNNEQLDENLRSAATQLMAELGRFEASGSKIASLWDQIQDELVGSGSEDIGQKNYPFNMSFDELFGGTVGRGKVSRWIKAFVSELKRL